MAPVVRGAGWPTPGHDAAPAPIGTPPAAPGDPSHRFLLTQDDGKTPVAFDPCRQVPVVMRPDKAPPGAEDLVRQTLQRMSETTGLVFVYEGPTDEAPSPQRRPFQPDRYGDRWAPVLIAFVDETEEPDFAADTAGQAGGDPQRWADSPLVYVTGQVELYAPFYADALADPAQAPLARAVLLHELGHLAGLAHVNDPVQLMYADNVGTLDFAPGDLTGLATLGAGRCVPDL